MTYLVYSDQINSVKNRAKSIVKKTLTQIDEMNYAKFDATTTLVQEIVDECQFVALGYDKKVVILENAYFLEKPKPRCKIESDQDYKKLIDFINNPSEEATLVIVVFSEDLDKKSEVFKAIEQNGKIIHIEEPSENDWLESAGTYCRKTLGMNIAKDALQELINRCGGDITLFQNSAQKLRLYSQNISYDDVCLLVAKPLDENTFELFNYLIEGKAEQAIGLFRDLKQNNVEPVTLISMLARQFRLLNQILYLVKKGFNNDEIGAELKIKPGRVYMIRKQAGFITDKVIRQTLDDLYNLDYQIKNGLVDRHYAFELFLINFKRK